MIDVRDVSVRYRAVDALSAVSLTVESGECVHVRGHNGSGKSTLMRVVAGLEVPDSGSARVGGQEATSRAARAARAYVPDVPPLYDYLSARETATLAARLWGTSITAVLAGLRQVGLEDALDVLVHEMSLGMRKKLSFVVCTVHEPPIVVLDEPFSGLDVDTVEYFRTMLRTWRAQGGTLLVTSHDEAPLAGLIDRRVTLTSGHLIEPEPPLTDRLA